jgi:hypothetical protein
MSSGSLAAVQQRQRSEKSMGKINEDDEMLPEDVRVKGKYGMMLARPRLSVRSVNEKR